jgi:urease accessory protein
MAGMNNIFYIMQLFGGNFPSGGFSQSWGLETYVSKGLIVNEDGFFDFLETWLDSVVSKCEGPILLGAYNIAEALDAEALDSEALDSEPLDAEGAEGAEGRGKIHALEELSRAIKVTQESREPSLRMGKAFLRIMAEAIEDSEIKLLHSFYEKKGITYPVACGVVCGRLGLGQDDCIDAFVFSTVNSLVQCGVKLIPLGNTQAQKLMARVQPLMEKAAGTGRGWYPCGCLRCGARFRLWTPGG